MSGMCRSVCVGGICLCSEGFFGCCVLSVLSLFGEAARYDWNEAMGSRGGPNSSSGAVFFRVGSVRRNDGSLRFERYHQYGG